MRESPAAREPSPSTSPSLAALRTQLLAGLVICVVLLVGLGGWAATAELSGAVIASGTVAVEAGLKKVQHPTGGVVGELRVTDGTVVKAGDVLMRLDETVTRSNLELVRGTIDDLEARHARLTAERDGTDAATFPPELLLRATDDPALRVVLDGERALLLSRRNAREGKKRQLHARVGQLEEEIVGLEAQRGSKIAQIELIRKELDGVEGLYERNLVTITRVAALQREAARLEGERGELLSSGAQARGRIAETELQLIQIDQDAQTEVLEELRETEAKLAELKEREIAAQDQLRRIDIRSPQDGVVHQLAVHTVGGVIAPGETVMLIVPQAGALTVEAHIAPGDIDQVAAGQRALLRFSAFSQRTTPELPAEVVQLDADLTREPQTGAAYYVARLRLDDAETGVGEASPLKLVPGMPVEVHIRTETRTALSFLVKPLTDQVARAFREQ